MRLPYATRKLFIILLINIYKCIIIDIFFFYFRQMKIAMVGNKDISLKDKQYFVELVSDKNTLLEIVKKLNRDNEFFFF